MALKKPLTIFALVLLLVYAVLWQSCTVWNIDELRKQATAQVAMVWVPGGNFTMGSSDSLDYGAYPPHRVLLSGFHIGKYEITQIQYEAVMGYNPSYYHGGNSADSFYDPTETAAGELQYMRPVEQVSWYDAVEFCNKLSSKEGLDPAYTITDRYPQSGYPIESAYVTIDWNANGYRLPTEAQWEYAAKGGNASPEDYTYTGSNNLDTVAWHWDNSRDRTHEAGKKAPNALGLYDMSGNVWEWCWDWYGNYNSNTRINPRGAAAGTIRVRRGGSWGNVEQYLRTASRGVSYPSDMSSGLGFRVVLP